MDSRENNYAFIDSQNVNLGVRESGWKLDFRIVLSPNRDKCSAFLKKGAREKIAFMNNLKNKLAQNEKAPLEDGTSRSAFPS